MADPVAVHEARRALGRQLAALRRAAGFSQHQLAAVLHYGRSSVANVETGRQNVGREFWARCDQLTDAGGALLGAYDRFRGLLVQHQRAEADRAGCREPTAGTEPISTDGPGFVADGPNVFAMTRRTLLGLGSAMAAAEACRLPPALDQALSVATAAGRDDADIDLWRELVV